MKGWLWFLISLVVVAGCIAALWLADDDSLTVRAALVYAIIAAIDDAKDEWERLQRRRSTKALVTKLSDGGTTSSTMPLIVRGNPNHPSTWRTLDGKPLLSNGVLIVPDSIIMDGDD